MNILIDILRERCPHCHEGAIFEYNGNPLLFRMPKMKSHCSVCNHHFEKEPGYFFGAMYVSYGLAVAEMFVTLFIAKFIFNLNHVTLLLVIGSMAFLLSAFNFRKSRTAWMYLFTKQTSKKHSA